MNLYNYFLQIAGIPYKELSIGIPKEIAQNEKRVALVPAVVETLTKKGFTINVEENAGVEAKFTNQNYEAAGGHIKVRRGEMHEATLK